MTTVEARARNHVVAGQEFCIGCGYFGHSFSEAMHGVAGVGLCWICGSPAHRARQCNFAWFYRASQALVVRVYDQLLRVPMHGDNYEGLIRLPRFEEDAFDDNHMNAPVDGCFEYEDDDEDDDPDWAGLLGEVGGDVIAPGGDDIEPPHVVNPIVAHLPVPPVALLPVPPVVAPVAAVAAALPAAPAVAVALPGVVAPAHAAVVVAHVVAAAPPVVAAVVPPVVHPIPSGVLPVPHVPARADWPEAPIVPPPLLNVQPPMPLAPPPAAAVPAAPFLPLVDVKWAAEANIAFRGDFEAVDVYKLIGGYKIDWLKSVVILVLGLVCFWLSLVVLPVMINSWREQCADRLWVVFGYGPWTKLFARDVVVSEVNDYCAPNLMWRIVPYLSLVCTAALVWLQRRFVHRQDVWQAIGVVPNCATDVRSVNFVNTPCSSQQCALRVSHTTRQFTLFSHNSWCCSIAGVPETTTVATVSMRLLDMLRQKCMLLGYDTDPANLAVAIRSVYNAARLEATINLDDRTSVRLDTADYFIDLKLRALQDSGIATLVLEDAVIERENFHNLPVRGATRSVFGNGVMTLITLLGVLLVLALFGQTYIVGFMGGVSQRPYPPDLWGVMWQAFVSLHQTLGPLATSSWVFVVELGSFFQRLTTMCWHGLRLL